MCVFRAVRAAMIRRSRISSCELPDDPEDLDSPEAIEAGSLTIENDESKPVQNGIIPLVIKFRLYFLLYIHFQNCGNVLRFIIYMLCRTMGLRYYVLKS